MPTGFQVLSGCEKETSVGYWSHVRIIGGHMGGERRHGTSRAASRPGLSGKWTLVMVKSRTGQQLLWPNSMSQSLPSSTLSSYISAPVSTRLDFLFHYQLVVSAAVTDYLSIYSSCSLRASPVPWLLLPAFLFCLMLQPILPFADALCFSFKSLKDKLVTSQEPIVCTSIGHILQQSRSP